jgi:hypothetical protein
MGAMATILILALGGVAAYYYFKIYNLKKRKMRMISRKVWKQVDWKKFRMRKSLKTKILKKMKNK